MGSETRGRRGGDGVRLGCETVRRFGTGGIGEALITTVAGLMVAIPTFVAYNYFVNRINHYVLEMERAATEIVNIVTENSSLPK